MPDAFILLNVELDKQAQVAEHLKRIRGVEDVCILKSEFDIVAKIQARSRAKVKEIIQWKIRKINSVRSTQTMFIAERRSHLLFNDQTGC
jgi:DNA-binding Lrp family transcriptional regulator